MKNALISPNEQVSYISSWQLVGNQYEPVFTVVGERVAEVAEQQFEVAPPLFWVVCEDYVTSTDYYYDPSAATINTIPAPAPEPKLTDAAGQPSVVGAQTL